MPQVTQGEDAPEVLYKGRSLPELALQSGQVIVTRCRLESALKFAAPLSHL